jgi:hypothetical protein
MRANLRSKDEDTGGEVAMGDKVILDNPSVMGILLDIVVQKSERLNVPKYSASVITPFQFSPATRNFYWNLEDCNFQLHLLSRHQSCHQQNYLTTGTNPSISILTIGRHLQSWYIMRYSQIIKTR